MIELSLGKMVLLALIALIVLGPEKLPGAARTAGALLRRVRSGWDNVRAEVERELEIEEIKRSAREAVAGAEAAQQQVKDTLKSAHDPFAEAAAMVKLQSSASSNAVPEPQVVTPKEGVTNRPLLNPQPDDASPANHLVDMTLENPVSVENGMREAPSTDRATDDQVADSQVADNRALEGVQSELPLDEPPMNVAHAKPVPDKDSHHGDSRYKDPPHGSA